MNIKKSKGTTIIILIATLILQSMWFPNKNNVYAAVTGYVTGTALNVRVEPGTDKSILKINKTNVQLKKGEKVNIIGEKIVNNVKWYKISFVYNSGDDLKNNAKEAKGYVSSDFMALTLTEKVNAVINSKSKVKIKVGAGDKKAYLKDEGKVVALKSGKKLRIIKETVSNGQKWFKVSFTYKGYKFKGYILSNNIKITTTPKVVAKPIEEPTEQHTVPTTEDIVKISTGVIRQVNLLGLFTEPKSTSTIVELKGQKIYISEGQIVDILGTETVDSLTWYMISIDYNGEKVIGYIQDEYIIINEESQEPMENTTESSYISDADFEQKLTNEGFPESYKTSLMLLHEKYPYWEFKAMHTGLDWNTVIQNESKVGVNLIPNSKNIAWKSLEKGAYNWSTDTFVPYDGASWVTASRTVIEYYMDPRNFLTEKEIFQFESISYQSDYQNISGIEAILKNTPMYNSYSTWYENEEVKSLLYSQLFMEAAIISGVSPYHLASRVKQEVVTGATSMSQIVSGTVAGYEGLYNFYNIGATGSTSASGLIANGLKYASNGTSNATTNALYLIPWNNPYRAIVGGAQYIASSYIKRGQNTVYLEKFNVTPISTYSHQYMANVEAAYSEAIKTFAAYSGLEDVSVEFFIPVYNNMPLYPSPKPINSLNPNNWLKSLEVYGYNLTPTFDITSEQVYNLIVNNDVQQVTINAVPVNSSASVVGSGERNLAVGINEIIIAVTAANGNIKEYKIYIVRE